MCKKFLHKKITYQRSYISYSLNLVTRVGLKYKIILRR